jgi:UDPglucose 6-dehydrogenase
VKRIAIIGSGVVGEATGKGLSVPGHKIVFVDTRISTLKRLENEGFETSKPEQLDGMPFDVSIICLPTPTKKGRPDLSSFDKALPHLGKALSTSNNWSLVVIRSTVLPGTTETYVIPQLQAYSGKSAGRDFGVCFNPEFMREKSSVEDFAKPWSIVIGALDSKSTDNLLDLYSLIIKTAKPSLTLTDLRTAELIKYAQNYFNAAKISFSNEIWNLSHKIGVDGDKVMEAVARSAEGMWNAQYGIRGGYAFEGNCLPKDMSGLLTYANEELKIEMPMLHATLKVNTAMKSGSQGREHTI